MYDEALAQRCVHAIATGDQGALGELFDRASALVHGIALRVLRVTEDAEEVVIDTFVQVWSEAARYDPARGSVRSWLQSVAHSRAIDRLRRRRARPDQVASVHPDELPASYTPMVADHAAEVLDGLQAGSRVRRAFASLTPNQQRCVALAFLEERTHAEIAQALQMPLGSVKSHVRRGLLALRSQLDQIDPKP